MGSPGPRNLLTDVSGLQVGHAHDAHVRTGVTVISAPGRAVAGVEQRGGAPGTRETDLMDPACLVDKVDAVVLSGGSVYGLDAASAVTRKLGAAGHGFQLSGSPLVAPIVPAAILFDLRNGGDKTWGEAPPYDRLGGEALAALGTEFMLGKVGAGFGATAGLYEGGLGSASYITDDGFEVGALVAVNSWGSPFGPGGPPDLWARRYALGLEMGNAYTAPNASLANLGGFPSDTKAGAAVGENTTIAVVATNAALSPAETRRLAIMADDGLARSLRPVHTPMDGDTVFALATGTKAELGPDEARPLLVTRLGSLAADCLARAVGRAIYAANPDLFV